MGVGGGKQMRGSRVDHWIIPRLPFITLWSLFPLCVSTAGVRGREGERGGSVHAGVTCGPGCACTEHGPQSGTAV